MSGSTLSNLLLVKLESDSVENFCPDDAVHIWMVSYLGVNFNTLNHCSQVVDAIIIILN